MTEYPHRNWLAPCGLPDAWRAQTAWRVLDTGFDHASRFLACWQAWQADPERPRMLHYVALASDSFGADALLDVPMTRQDMADYLGLTIETVSRTLTQFQQDGLIALPTTRKVLLRDRAALEAMVD